MSEPNPSAAMGAESRRAGGSAPLTAAHEFFRRGEASADRWSLLIARSRDWESAYRDRWRHDKVVRSTHGVNCTGSCSWNVYVKDGLITWETQAVDYPRTDPDRPDHEPRGCPRGASFSWYTYSPARLKYPYRARGVMKDGRRFGGPPKPYQPPDTPAGKINLTDPDSRNVKTPRGWVQGYNAQAATTEQQIVIAAEVTVDSPDFGHLEPMVKATETDLAAAGVTARPHVVVADAGYWHQAQMDRLINRGIGVLIPPDAGKRKGARPGWDGGFYAFMRGLLATDFGGELYAKRQGMIEPVFAHTKFNRGMDRFLRRGRAACRSEWRLITATHNLVKLHRHQLASVGA